MRCSREYHPHLWVRSAALRLVGQVLESVDPLTATAAARANQALSSQGDVFALGLLNANQLDHRSLDEGNADQVVKYLV